MLGDTFLFFNVIKWEKLHFKHPSNSQSISQKIMIHHKLGNLILFKLCMEPSVFKISLKINKQKYGTTSMVAMTTSKQCIFDVFLYDGKYLCNDQIANLAQFIDTCFDKEKKCLILFLKLFFFFLYSDGYWLLRMCFRC
jgi:hypothetical protein